MASGFSSYSSFALINGSASHENRMSGGKSVGSLETWEPDDKSFSKHVISGGVGDVTPNDGAVCRVNLSLIDAVDIEDSDLGNYRLNETVEVTVGEGDTVLSEMLDKVVCSMKEKEACYIKSKIDAKGKKVDELLSKNKQLKFNVILQSFNRAAELCDLEADEKLERAQHHKDEGTELFRQDRMVYAVKRYKKALSVVQDITDVTSLPDYLRDQYRVLKCHCYLNLGACYLKAEKYNAAIDVCTHALEIDASSVKGLFRRGQAYYKLHQFDEAVADFHQVLAMEPGNKAVQNQLTAIEHVLNKEKQMCQKMFS